MTSNRLGTLVLLAALITTGCGQSRQSLSHAPRPEDYPAKASIAEPRAEIDFQSLEGAESRKEEILGAVSQDANFGGYFRVIEWGCGTSCRNLIVADLRTGKLYPGIVTSNAPQFGLGTLLLVDAPVVDQPTDQSCATCSAHYYVWRNNKFEAITVLRK